MKSERSKAREMPTVREKVTRESSKRVLSLPQVKTSTSAECDDCRAKTAFHAWEEATLTPSFNCGIDFAHWKIVPAGKRAVIELVTASVYVPAGEWARLRMNTSLGMTPSNLDLALTAQGQTGTGLSVYVGTHSIRAYTDNEIQFNVNRDNDTTTGYAVICVSGYIV